MERMDEFFKSRVDMYDEHMLNNVEGCREAYSKMAQLVPDSCGSLLDLGCGTGLDLDEIFRLQPKINVTGIDLTQAMLDKLCEKHGDKQMHLICGSYFDIPFGLEKYDCVVSFQTLHHFSHKKKTELYKKIYTALKSGGVYIECDYMVERQEEEDFYFSENCRIRREMNIGEDEYYHYDTPCTIDNQIKMMQSEGFNMVKKVFRIGNTTIITACKE